MEIPHLRVHTPSKLDSTTLLNNKDSLNVKTQKSKRTYLNQGECSVGFSETTNSCSRVLNSSSGPEKQQKGQWPMFPCDFTPEIANLNTPTLRQKRWKKLVPRELSINLSLSYEAFLRVACLIDDRLFKMRGCGYRESLGNLRVIVRRESEEEIVIETIQKMNYLVKGYLLVCQDPLKNIAIGLPKNKGTKTQRKRQLRTALYNFAADNFADCDVPEVEEEIPSRQLQIVKVEAFFPQTLRPDNKKKSENILDEKNLQVKRKTFEVKEKEFQQQINKSEICQRASLEEVEELGLKIVKLYSQHQVRNIYKADLVKALIKQGSPLEKVMACMGQLVNTGLFIRCFSSFTMTVCELQPSELQASLRMIMNTGRRKQTP